VNLSDTLVVLDTCVLMPPRLSDVLMDLRARQLFSLHWSDDIEAEYVRNMQSVLGFPKTSVLRRLAAMQRCCPEWRVSFSNIDLAAVPSEVDSKDHHVAAAALALRRYADEEADSETPCDVILVTDNTADLAEVPMARCGVTVMRPGTFLDLVCDSLLPRLKKPSCMRCGTSGTRPARPPSCCGHSGPMAPGPSWIHSPPSGAWCQ
jgi:hypothetical protein